MAVNTKAIKQRMKSIGNTKKITKAMEMVSAAKMRRAVDATLATRPYAAMAREIMERLSHAEKAMIPLLATRPVRRILLILVSANRGLCGSFNANLYKKMAQLLRDPKNVARHRVYRVYGDEDVEEPGGEMAIDVLGIGKRSAVITKKLQLNLTALFDHIGERPRIEEILPIARMAVNDFVAERYDKVLVVYTDYKSSLLQVTKVRQVLPISEIDLDKMASEVEAIARDAAPKESAISLDNYVFEPAVSEILSTILPRLVEVQVYQAILESAASEHSARMVAMKNANEAAGDMLSELRLSFNKARQAAITQEISEIVGGAAALE